MAKKKKSSNKKPSAPGKDATAPVEDATAPAVEPTPTPAPDPDKNVKAESEPKANETPKETGVRPRLWYVEPVRAATLKTKHGVLIKGRPKPVVEGSGAYEFYKARADVRVFASSEG